MRADGRLVRRHRRRRSKRARRSGEDQKARLAELRDKVKLAPSMQAGGSEIIDFDWQYLRDEVLSIAAGPEGARFTSLAYLQDVGGSVPAAVSAPWRRISTASSG